MTRHVVREGNDLARALAALGVALAGLIGTVARADPGAPSVTSEPAVEATGAERVSLGVTYFGDALATVSGGVAPGWAYEGRLGLLLDANLDGVVAWQGAHLHASLNQIHGQEPTPSHVGALSQISGIEAEPNTRLFNLWVEGNLGPHTTLRAGQFTADQEFAISSNAALFVNSTFGWPNIFAQDLPSGGPAYPIGGLGVRLIRTTSRGAFLIAVFNGDPAGPGGGDPQQRDRSGLNSFRLSGGPFAIAEAQFHLPLAGAQVRLGSWWLGRKVPAQALDQGLGVGSISQTRDGDWGAYGSADFYLVKRGDTVISGFLRVAAAPGDRNLVSTYADAGLTVPGSSWGRSKDQLGLAVSWSGVGRAARALDARSVASGDLAFERDHELVVELTYQAQMTPQWWIQPDIQWVVHPGGRIPLASDPTRRIPDAVIVGVRNTLKF